MSWATHDIYFRFFKTGKTILFYLFNKTFHLLLSTGVTHYHNQMPLFCSKMTYKRLLYNSNVSILVSLLKCLKLPLKIFSLFFTFFAF